MFLKQFAKKLSYALMFFSSKLKALKYGERHAFQHESPGEKQLRHLPWQCWLCPCVLGTVGMEGTSGCSSSKDG